MKYIVVCISNEYGMDRHEVQAFSNYLDARACMNNLSWRNPQRKYEVVKA